MSEQNDKRTTLKTLADLAYPGIPTPATGIDYSAYGLSAFFKRPEVTGLYYNGQNVVLDGYTFNRCRFDNCKLEVSSLNFSLIHCVIDPSTVILYGAESAKLIKLFNARFPWAYENFPHFVPDKHADGTISITDYPV